MLDVITVSRAHAVDLIAASSIEAVKEISVNQHQCKDCVEDLLYVAACLETILLLAFPALTWLEGSDPDAGRAPAWVSWLGIRGSNYL